MKHTSILLLTIASFSLVGCLGGSETLKEDVEVVVPPQQKVVELSLSQGAKVVPGMKITGTAPGTWFSEGQLPVELQNEKGEVITVVPAQADGEWMTEGPVSFSAQLDFQTTATSGKIVIRKDNPSGLAENDASSSLLITY